MKDIVGILLLLSLVGMILSIPISLYLSVKQDKKEWDEREKEAKAWLEAEMKKPKSVIEFTTVDGVVRKTEPHDPYIIHPGSRWGYQADSNTRASRCLEAAYERGFFLDDQMNTYPTCNILSAKVTP